MRLSMRSLTSSVVSDAHPMIDPGRWIVTSAKTARKFPFIEKRLHRGYLLPGMIHASSGYQSRGQAVYDHAASPDPSFRR